MISPADHDWLRERAIAAGFGLAGLAGVPDFGADDAHQLDQRFGAWIEAGHAGEMEYLKRVNEHGDLLRGDLRRSMPWAKSVLVCALNYNADAPLSTKAALPGAGWIARYAWSGGATSPEGHVAGSDYHDVLLPKLHVVEANLHERFPGCETRCYVDTGPLVERGFAERAGVGWIGKNTCVLNQQHGSWLLLGVIITSLELAPEAYATPAFDRCGTCTRCIDACPTDALVAPRQMDASRCIAYLTIEKKGSIPEELRAPMGRQVFGCDICQDVCPWNRKAPITSLPLLPPRRELINPQLSWLGAMDGPTFNRWFRGSPLERTRRKRVLRNVAIAMGNSGLEQFVPQLEKWSQGDDAALAECAGWALQQVQAAVSAKALEPQPID